MKINPNQVSDYKNKGYNYLGASKKLVGGQEVMVKPMKNPI